MNRSKGDMYDWVEYTWNPLAGECPHGCPYCYVRSITASAVRTKYSGAPRLYPKELTNLGKDKTIFVCNMTDLFAEGVPDDAIKTILGHCRKYYQNHYVFQSKNPARMLKFVGLFPLDCYLGTTIESNRVFVINSDKVPYPRERAKAMKDLKRFATKTFVTIEPVIDFDLPAFADLIVDACPDFVNIGADSCGNNLPEPSSEKIINLVEILRNRGITVRLKSNLRRIIGDD